MPEAQSSFKASDKGKGNRDAHGLAMHTNTTIPALCQRLQPKLEPGILGIAAFVAGRIDSRPGNPTKPMNSRRGAGRDW
jgi:hypothetical protein